jgi:membrane-bound serine protease (ClpP class)
LVIIDVFLFPGTMIAALNGVTMILASLVWMMLDLWPGEPVTISGNVLLRPLANVLAGAALAIAAFLLLLRFLPKGGPWGGMVLESAVSGDATPDSVENLLGQSGKAATALFPSGQVEISGKRYEAKLAMGFAEAGTPVKVTGVSEFGLIVETLT